MKALTTAGFRRIKSSREGFSPTCRAGGGRFSGILHSAPVCINAAALEADLKKGADYHRKAEKIGDKVFLVYHGIGVAAMGLLAVLVIFSVIARYFFSLSWKQLSEFNVTLFAFTTFWGMGINVIKGEHVIIDIVYDRVPPAIKRWLSVVNYLIDRKSVV